MKQRKSGFTLIELLVVIAIIAILAAILFPVFAQARAKARQVVCMSNEKQLTTGILMYNQDYNDRWIDACTGYNLGIANVDTDNNCFTTGTSKFSSPIYLPFWIKPPTPASTADGDAVKENYLLKPYLRNKNVGACPTLRNDSNNAFKTPTYAFNELIYNGDQSPYASGNTKGNTAYIPPDCSPNCASGDAQKWQYMGAGGRLAAQLASPASLIVIWEHNNAAVLCNTWGVTSANHWDKSHTEGFNAAFADGHVKRYTVSQLRNQLVSYWTLPQ